MKFPWLLFQFIDNVLYTLSFFDFCQEVLHDAICILRLETETQDVFLQYSFFLFFDDAISSAHAIRKGHTNRPLSLLTCQVQMAQSLSLVRPG